MHASELRETARVAFARYDEDDSGAIDARELQKLVQDLGGAMTDSDMRAALHVLDRDRSGSIELDEFLSWWTTKVANLDGNGTTTELEKTLERLKELGCERFRVDVHTAAWRGFHDVVTRLVQDDRELASECDATDYGNLNTPLHYAAYQGHVDVCATLLEHGASVNAANGSGCTPVFFAAQQSHEPVVRLLLEKGADIKIKDTEHQLSPVDVCHDDAILKLFKSLSGSAPGTPHAPTLSAAGERQLTVTWTHPKSAFNEVAPISLYKLRLSSPTAPPKNVLAPGSMTELVVSDLAPDAEYVCELAAANLHGMSDFSVKSEALRTLRARPAAPQNLVVCDVDAQGVRLQWSLALDEDDAMQCVVQQSLGAKGDSGWKVVYRGDASLTYLFRVAAVNSTGCGEFSAPAVARTLGAADSARAETKGVRVRVVADAIKLLAAKTSRTAAAAKPTRALLLQRRDSQDNQVASEAKASAAPQQHASAMDAKDTSQSPSTFEAIASARQPTPRRERDDKSEPSRTVRRGDDLHSDDDEFVYYQSDASCSDSDEHVE